MLPYVMAVGICKGMFLEGPRVVRNSELSNTAPIASVPDLSTELDFSHTHTLSRLSSLLPLLCLFLGVIDTVLLFYGPSLQSSCNTQCLRDQHSGRASRLSL